MSNIDNTDLASKYELTISLHALDHLGINLYSNVAAVLTEAVANAYDADAENVNINLDLDKDTIMISDDGHGMTVSDMNEKYLKVAYRRRGENNDQQRSEVKKRLVMGRKGLGKLSLFSIAGSIEIHSVRDGMKHGCKMNVVDIRELMKNKESTYHPVPVSEENIKIDRGTTIILSELSSSRLAKTRSSLPQKLSRRFSVIGSEDFKVFVNNREVSSADRGDLRKVEFAWSFDSLEKFNGFDNIREKETVDNRFDVWEQDWKVKGWIGTSSWPSDLQTSDGSINGIVILSRGRLIHENVLKAISDAKHFTHYITGQIEADFLDEGLHDVATSDRQRLIEDDPRVEALLNFIKHSLRSKIEPQWNIWRSKHKLEKVINEHPAVQSWLDTLGSEELKKHAKKVISLIGKTSPENKEDRRELLKQGVIAFERLRLSNMTHKLTALNDDVNIEQLLDLIGSIDDVEASMYRDIIKGRLSIVRAFHKAARDDEKEKVMQEQLFKHLWLIDPAWERAAGDEVIETSLKDMNGFNEAKLTPEEAAGRLDIAYKTYAGKHIIIEMKRFGARTKFMDLVNQGIKYVDKLRKILETQHPEEKPDIEVIFVLGKKPADTDSDRMKSGLEMISKGSRIKTYNELIQGALRSYQDYVDKDAEVKSIERIVDNL